MWLYCFISWGIIPFCCKHFRHTHKDCSGTLSCIFSKCTVRFDLKDWKFKGTAAEWLLWCIISMKQGLHTDLWGSEKKNSFSPLIVSSVHSTRQSPRICFVLSCVTFPNTLLHDFTAHAWKPPFSNHLRTRPGASEELRGHVNHPAGDLPQVHSA